MADKYTSRYSGTQIDQALEDAMNIGNTIQSALGSFTVPTNQIQNGAVTMGKLGTDVKTYLGDIVAVDDRTVDNVSVSSNSTATATLDFELNGYTCLGVVSIQISDASSSGSNSNNVVLRGFYKWGSNAQVYLRNVGSSAARVKVQAKLLYIKNMA